MSAAPIVSLSKNLEELTEEKIAEFRRRGLYAARSAGLSYADAEDLIQGTLLKCHVNYPQYEGRGNLKNWFYSILANELCDYKRRIDLKKRHAASGILEQDTIDPVTPEQKHYTEEKKTFVETIVTTQPPLTQIIYHLHTQD